VIDSIELLAQAIDHLNRVRDELRRVHGGDTEAATLDT